MKFVNQKTNDILYALFKNYNFEKSKKNNFANEIKILKLINIDGTDVFNQTTPDVRIDETSKENDGSVIFTIEGGTISTPEFQTKLITLIKDANPSEIIVAAYHDQVGEFEIEMHVDGDITRYFTGSEGECDEKIFDASEDDNFISTIRDLYQNNELVMPKNEDEEENILDDPFWYKMAYPIAAIRSLIFGIPVFLIGWFAFDAFNTSLIAGGIVSLLNTIYQWLGLYGHKLSEEDEINDMLIEDAADLGLDINKDQAQALANKFNDIMAKNGIS
jgi:hypothetical protein